IEVGEIESALLEHPAAREAVVVAIDLGTGFKQLVAYVVADKEQAAVGRLRSHLKEKLPDYMMPSIFIYLDSLPLTPNGKVDRRALPAPCEQVRRQGDFVQPRTNTEQKLANIWTN